MDEPKLKTITLSELQRYLDAGYTPVTGCDAAQANSDYFMVLRRENGGVEILCPTFLRGGLGIAKGGSISY